MDYYAGIDVSLGRSRVCVVGATGQIIREAKVVSEPRCAGARDLGRRRYVTL